MAELLEVEDDYSGEDDGLRLVYADWLEERGDVRGEFLRTAVAISTAESLALPALHQCLQELRPLVSSRWLVSANRSIAEDDVREAVFRNLLGDGSVRLGTYFLQVEEGMVKSGKISCETLVLVSNRFLQQLFQATVHATMKPVITGYCTASSP